MKDKDRQRIAREEFAELGKRAEERFASFLKAGRYKDVLIAMGNLSKYSLNNQLCIIAQKPEATTVHGIREWNRLKRRVKKGERGIRIFQPVRLQKEGQDKEKEGFLAFRVGYVFDLSQTEGEEIKAFRLDEEATVENKEKIIRGLLKAASTIGYSARCARPEELGEGCFGSCSHKEKEIRIREKLSDLQEISTVAHECAHALAHGHERKDLQGLEARQRRGMKEVEAESIACIVCAYLGLDTENFNFSYIASWAEGDIAKFRKNLNLVSSCAGTLIESVEEELIGRDG